MPNTPTNNDALASASSTNWLDGAPGGDVPFDQLFGTEPEASFSSATPTSTPSATPAAGEPTATTPAASEFEIRTRTGSIYKTIDAATKGIEEKDTLIQQLREKYRAVTGADPLKAQEPVQPQQPTTYLGDANKFADDLAEAAKTGNAQKYRDTIVNLMEEYFSPAKPLIVDFSRARANEQVRNEYAEFEAFRNSEAFQQTLDRNSALKNAIQIAESNVAYSGQLPELYRLAYESHTARRVPELVQAAKQTPAAPTPTARPVVQGSSLTPAAPVTQRSEQDLLRTSEGRKEIIQRARAAGIEDYVW